MPHCVVPDPAATGGMREPNQGTIGDGLRHFPAGPVIRPSHLCAHSAAAPKGEVMAWHFSANGVRET